jgi:hypothetical protein
MMIFQGISIAQLRYSDFLPCSAFALKAIRDNDRA